ncbi:DUF1453 domain-containing protein [Streptomyces sp. NA02950]|uniref:DUF1453 domain-containing protein n=1 Tax=Streptomyces sp. NA02950 TaxID=2742137 RepID=UPI001591A893|nr:DUF1453 domain-containing protein [Streptomyces sp. NA02950]QKV92160.1 DUF1453 domain-containing protein [Streptomyces sp. NA02950]
MSGIPHAVVIAAVVVVVIARQFRPQKVVEDTRRWWALPVVLGWLALREPGLIDHRHQAAAVALLVGDLLAGAVTGAAWAWTSRVWTDDSGAVWARGGKVTAAVWAGGLVLRLALAAAGALAGVRQESGSITLTLAVSLLLSSAVVMLRAHGPELMTRGVGKGTLGR